VYLFDPIIRAVMRAIPRTIAAVRPIAAAETMAVTGAMVEAATKATITMMTTNPTIIASTMMKKRRMRGRKESRRGTSGEIRRSTKIKTQMKTRMTRTR